MSRRPLTCFVLAGVLLAGAVSLPAQSQSASMSVSVRVVRPCSVTPPAPAGDGAVRIDCGRAPSSHRPTAQAGIVAVAGAAAAASVSTGPGPNGPTVTINF